MCQSAAIVFMVPCAFLFMAYPTPCVPLYTHDIYAAFVIWSISVLQTCSYDQLDESQLHKNSPPLQLKICLARHISILAVDAKFYMGPLPCKFSETSLSFCSKNCLFTSGWLQHKPAFTLYSSLLQDG
jgi:hypothetical protein